ncbi:SGNH/GDSL hydrolase family protein [Pantoea sp. GbtcB22]|uniref:SGNH/GDSL hydrolase family protein n=1 Tax=Pantoea sp. GbtcB22 TaxID=2824767 RepID=UPI001C310249|nr:SGNH/GDSL hydrolase family protein [Pantoea sp. GbtcB22]
MRKTLLAVLITSAPLLAQAEDHPGTFIIAAYGDSTTAGVTASGNRNILSKNNEVSFLQQMLREKYGNNIEVKNHGMPGAQVSVLVYDKDNTPMNWSERMAKSDANMILINYAINDARINFFKDKGERIETPQEYKRIITELVKGAKANNKLVVLQEPNPICGKAERWNVWPYVYQLNEVAKEQQVPIVKQYSAIKQNRDWQSEMSPDCIHPNEMLYKQKAERTFNVLSSTFDSVLSRHSS